MSVSVSASVLVRNDGVPQGSFSKYTWHITNFAQVKRIFDTPEVNNPPPPPQMYSPSRPSDVRIAVVCPPVAVGAHSEFRSERGWFLLPLSLSRTSA